MEPDSSAFWTSASLSTTFALCPAAVSVAGTWATTLRTRAPTASSAAAVRAKAYTVGSDIVFGAGSQI